MSGLSFKQKADSITIMNPVCSNMMAERIPLAPRTFTSLENKTIYFVDIGWGGPRAGADVFQVMQTWFADNIPTAITKLIRKKGGYEDDDPALWKRVKAEADACIIGLSC
ncbi:MAG: hypothetical protein JXA46_14810 [Dehalococcoidales bacterium]|nr:hypothetical protein [Dehalococcoidales bacterium]